MSWVDVEPPSRDLQAILDQIDAEERAKKRATFEACDNCTSYEIRDLNGSVVQTYRTPCVRHAWAPGGIIG